MKVIVMRKRELPEGRGDELGHGFDVYWEQSGETFYIPSHRMPMFHREVFPGWKGSKAGGVGYCNYWVVASSCCHLLPEGTVCRLFTDEGKEVGKL